MKVVNRLVKTDKCISMIIHDLDHNLLGAVFSKWPLHITIVFYFTFDINMENSIFDRISEIAKKIGPIEVNPGKNVMYGLDKDTVVTEIDDVDNKLALLHSSLINGLTELGCQFLDLVYTFDNYSPHISDQDSRKCSDKPFTIYNISVVSKITGDIEHSKVISKIISL